MTDSIEPRVWLGCLACYNGGNLVGEWMSPGEAADATPETIHKGDDLARMEKDKREGYGEHEETWVMDSEHVPVRGEFGPDTCRAIADAFEVIEEHRWAAYLAYADHLGELPEPSAFEDAFSAEYESFRDYADERADEAIEVHCNADPYAYNAAKIRETALEFFQQYFDYERYADSLMQEYTVVDAPGGGVFIFNNI